MCRYRTGNMVFVYLLLLMPITLVVCRITTTDIKQFTVCKNHYASCRIKELWNARHGFYCYFYCGRNSWCRALTIKPVPSGVECTFHEGIVDVTCNSFPFIENRGYRLMLKKEQYTPPAKSNDDDDCSTGSCRCTDGFSGPECDRYVYDCKEANDTGMVLKQSGLTHVMVKPRNSDLAFEAQCNNYGQIAILARNINGDDVMFNRSREEYKYPFGTIGDFWLGLEHVFAVLNQGDTYKLQIYCRNFDARTEFSVYYQTFTIESGSRNYAMTTGQYASETNGSDGFGGNTYAPFCTYDKPCNGYPDHLNGGWWYVSGLENYALTNPMSSLMFKRQHNNFSVHQVSMSLENSFV